jgi:hypothetical protein
MARSRTTTWTPIQKSYIFWRFLANVTIYLSICLLFAAVVVGVNALSAEPNWFAPYFAASAFGGYFCFQMWKVYRDRDTVYCAALLFCENDPPTYAAEVAQLTAARDAYRSTAFFWNPIIGPLRIVYLILRSAVTSGREIHTIKLA